MKINLSKQVDNDALCSSLQEAGYECQKRKILFGGENLTVKSLDKMKYGVSLRKAGVLNFNPVMPVWVYGIALLIGFALFSFVLSAVFGETMVVTGGGLTVLIIILITDAIYKATKKEQINKFKQDLTNMIEKI